MEGDDHSIRSSAFSTYNIIDTQHYRHTTPSTHNNNTQLQHITQHTTVGVGYNQWSDQRFSCTGDRLRRSGRKRVEGCLARTQWAQFFKTLPGAKQQQIGLSDPASWTRHSDCGRGLVLLFLLSPVMIQF
jgi:hypothetical protein